MNGISLLDSFTGTNGANPQASLIDAGGGTYLGTTEFGGTSDLGVVFSFDTSNGITLLDSFDGANGAQPEASLIDAGGGFYLGNTYRGGDNYMDPINTGDGTVFAFDSTTNSITTLHSFDFINNVEGGYFPEIGALVDAGGGTYLGTTTAGGTTGNCVFYSIQFSQPTTDVPAPLPLFGVGAAYGFSRRLRQRIRAGSASPPPAGVPTRAPHAAPPEPAGGQGFLLSAE